MTHTLEHSCMGFAIRARPCTPRSDLDIEEMAESTRGLPKGGIPTLEAAALYLYDMPHCRLSLQAQLGLQEDRQKLMRLTTSYL
ncbi:hypothetical protein C8Q77DRAFT_211174 [Trametes polyzona]|nr:hypothetical protein C8Q77DRAFT_211174 [Trametes polyzona]